MSIKKLHIENIRGFSSVELPFELLPNYVNIAVAPNGFGKSSISTAFQCIQGSRLRVDNVDKHLHKEDQPSLLSILNDDIWLTANEEKNEISQYFSVNVIKSAVKPKAKMPRVNGYAVARPYLEMENIELRKVVPKISLDYSLASFKDELSPNQKVVPNLLKLCDSGPTRSFLLSNLSEIDKLKKKSTQLIFKGVREFIKSNRGTKQEISQEIETLFSEKVSDDAVLRGLIDGLCTIEPKISISDSILLLYQLNELREKNRGDLKKWLEFGDYQGWLEAARDFIRDVNSAWVEATISEKKGKVVTTFPQAESLSNGQRDLLYFACNLWKARDAGSSRPTILVIDEIFDYLDDANLLVAQYFLSNIIKYYKRRSGMIYIVILTHLDPVFFRGYALKKQRVIYLQSNSSCVSETMRKIIGQRDDCVWKEDLDKYFLHFHPGDRNISSVFNESFGLRKVLGTKKGFYDFLEVEWKKAVAGDSKYDPFAVCVFLRINIEKCAFEKISNEDCQRRFLETSGTANKLLYAESIGISVPEVCFILGILYNDALHRKDGVTNDSSVIIKLQNISLRKMMRAAIDW